MHCREFAPTQGTLVFGCRDEEENLFAQESEGKMRRVIAYSRCFLIFKIKDWIYFGFFRKSGVDRQYAQDKLRELGDGAAEVIVGRGGTVLVCGSVRQKNTLFCTLI